MTFAATAPQILAEVVEQVETALGTFAQPGHRGGAEIARTGGRTLRFALDDVNLVVSLRKGGVIEAEASISYTTPTAAIVAFAVALGGAA